ncbi:hypothetical protein HanXRQr2_Chr13g0610871 [Helianthus annuus]|uniref:Uncharacterized protein n=1 Tax=Helianthus annuus TaxID=4232 RepID=A0A9K3ELR0_HELAN|nr:hypothetical protein HanXRQr2_Chr13g0610871 [Helianthus annuus]
MKLLLIVWLLIVVSFIQLLSQGLYYCSGPCKSGVDKLISSMWSHFTFSFNGNNNGFAYKPYLDGWTSPAKMIGLGQLLMLIFIISSEYYKLSLLTLVISVIVY